MKKFKSIVLALVLFLLFILGGCQSKELTPEKIGETFVNNFIYYEDSGEFRDYFVDGKILEKQLRVKINSFQTHFSDVFDPVVGELSEKDKEKLASSLMEAVQKKSEYELRIQEETENEMTVVYEIRGLDYAKVIENTLGNIIELMTVNEGIEKENKESEEAVISGFLSALNKAETKKTAVTVELSFVKQKDKWMLKSNQDQAVNELMLSFISGVNDDASYDRETEQAIEQAIKIAEKKL